MSGGAVSVAIVRVAQQRGAPVVQRRGAAAVRRRRRGCGVCRACLRWGGGEVARRAPCVLRRPQRSRRCMPRLVRVRVRIRVRVRVRVRLRLRLRVRVRVGVISDEVEGACRAQGDDGDARRVPGAEAGGEKVRSECGASRERCSVEGGAERGNTMAHCGCRAGAERVQSGCRAGAELGAELGAESGAELGAEGGAERGAWGRGLRRTGARHGAQRCPHQAGTR